VKANVNCRASQGTRGVDEPLLLPIREWLFYPAKNGGCCAATSPRPSR